MFPNGTAKYEAVKSKIKQIIVSVNKSFDITLFS